MRGLRLGLGLKQAARTASGFSFSTYQSGLLAQHGAKTNLVASPKDFTGGGWIQFQGFAAANTATALDGTLTADTVGADGGAANIGGIYTSGITVANATAYTYSIFAKSAGHGGLQFTCHNDDSGGGQWGCTFNLDSGVLYREGTSADGYIIPIADGWYRCVVIVTSNDTSADIRLWPGPVSALDPAVPILTIFEGDGTSGVYLWQAQVIAGTYPDGGPIA